MSWVMSHIWMSHVTHINELSHVSHMNESCHTHEWLTSHYEGGMSHIWMRHLSHMNESCHMYEWLMSHIWMSHVTHMHGSFHTYDWIISHVRMSHVTRKELCWVGKRQKEPLRQLERETRFRGPRSECPRCNRPASCQAAVRHESGRSRGSLFWLHITPAIHVRWLVCYHMQHAPTRRKHRTPPVPVWQKRADEAKKAIQ